MSALKRTPASQWRQQSQLVQLPSGHVAELRRMNVLAMIVNSDNVPNFLLNKIHQEINGFRPNKKQDDVTLDAEVKDIADSMFFLARHAFVYPRLVDGEPQNDDEVQITDIDTADLAFAAEYVTGDAAAVATVNAFRDKEKANVEPVPASD